MIPTPCVHGSVNIDIGHWIAGLVEGNGLLQDNSVRNRGRVVGKGKEGIRYSYFLYRVSSLWLGVWIRVWMEESLVGFFVRSIS
jgi:hypothetical protein